MVKIRGRRIAPKGVPVANPAFDMTPPELVTAIVSDQGVIKSPVQDNISRSNSLIATTPGLRSGPVV